MGLIPTFCPGQYQAKGVNFDLSTYITNALGLGIADGHDGTLSVWLKPDSGKDAVSMPFFTTGNDAAGHIARVFCGRDSNNGISFSHWGTGSSPTRRILMQTDGVAQPITGGVWWHILASWSNSGLGNPNWVYINGSAATMLSGGGGTTLNGGTIFYSDTPAGVGYETDFTTQRYKGDMAELWFDPTFIDLSVQANREKFIKGGRPVELGDQGQGPTGSQPALCLRGGASQFLTNAGSGGNFTTTIGALTDATTSPP